MNKNKFKQYFEEVIPSLLNYKRWENEIYAFLSALIIGFIAHGYIFFNNITLHDNIYNFGVSPHLGCLGSKSVLWCTF